MARRKIWERKGNLKNKGWIYTLHSYPEWGENAWGNILYFLIDRFSQRGVKKIVTCTLLGELFSFPYFFMEAHYV